MRKTQPSSAISARSARDGAGAFVAASRLPALARSWVYDGDGQRHSPRTLEAKRDLLGKLSWFLEDRGYPECGTDELREFLYHTTHGHEEPGGRWGNPRNSRPTKPRTVKNYHSILRAFFNWCVADGALDASPMERIPTPVDRPDQVQPFTDEQVLALFAAAKKTLHPRRDTAVVYVLLDCGLRASELCGLSVGDVDLDGSRLTVREGKGGKGRVVPFSRDTRRALYQYLNEEERAPGDPLFASDRGAGAGEALTRHGVRFLIGRLGKAAKVDGARCSPHTFRHTFAVSFLRAGGNVFTLQQLLGHTHLAMTQRYVAVAQADLDQQHRQFSPVTNLKAAAKGRG